MENWEHDEAVQFVEELDGVGIGRWRWDIRTKTIHWSAELRRMYGLSASDHLPMTLAKFADLVHPEDRACVIAKVSETLSLVRAAHELRYRVLRADGTVRLILSRARLFCDASGQPKALCGMDVDLTADAPDMVQDRTDRNRPEDEWTLAESEARFRNIADNAPVMVWMTEKDGRCTFLSKSWYEFTGQSPKTGLGFGWLDAVHPDDRGWSRKRFLEAQARSEAFSLEYRLRREDGAYRWAIDAARPRLDENGECIGYIGSVIDITPRREAEEAARANERRAQNLFENAGVSLWDEDFSRVVSKLEEFRAEGVTDLGLHLAERPELARELLDLVILRDVNSFTVKLFGAPDKKSLLRSLASVFPPDSMHVFVRELEALWRGERFVEIEGPLARLDGEVFQALFTIVFDGARAERTLVSALDITQRKRLEERQQMLIYELNHRVKNSLASVQAIASQSFRGSSGPEARGNFFARLHAFSQAHDVLTKRDWHQADLREVIETAIVPHDPGEAFDLAGPSILLAPRQVHSFTLVFHEMCTNAIKHGALSIPGGKVRISWEETMISGARHLRLEWRERGGPPVVPPKRTGFGSRLINLETGNARFDYAKEGLTCVLEVAIMPPDTEV